MKLEIPPCYALVSGGKDSLTTASCLASCGKLKACVTFKTGIAVPDSLPFIEKVCADRGWPLEVYETPAVYEDLVFKYGFPGPARHDWFMRYLKGRGLRQFRKVNKNAYLASGVRADESERRTLSVRPISIWENEIIVAPIYDWLTKDVWEYFRLNKFERAPAYSTLQISGDCLCGAFARSHEPEAIARHYPDLWGRIANLQEAVKHKFKDRWRWGWGAFRERKKSTAARVICADCGDQVDEGLFTLTPPPEASGTK